MYIPNDVDMIITELNNHGYEAYAVGGCVRDSLLKRTPKDWDITTSAKPEEVKQVFKRTIDTGIQHGTVTVMIGKEGYEVTTYRVDGEYADHRHPDTVTFTVNLEEDLKRRDFTINAMAWHPRSGIVDLFDGQKDLAEGRIRCVGCPDERFDEDALRMMRAVRFSAQLGFNIEEETSEAIRRHATDLKNVSAERVREELVKLLTSAHPEKIHDAWALGITAVVLPEYDRIVGVPVNNLNHIYDIETHTIKTLCEVPASQALRLTMLFHDFGKVEVRRAEGDHDVFPEHAAASERLAAKIMKRLKFDNDNLNRVRLLVKYHSMKYAAEESSVRRCMNIIGRDYFEDFMCVQRADLMGKHPDLLEKGLIELAQKEAICHEIIRRDDCFEVKKLAVTGRDLIMAGIPQGPKLGLVLAGLLDQVIDDQSLNQKEKLLELAKDIFKQMD